MVIDLYEDRHRGRFAFPLIILILFLFIVFTIIAATEDPDLKPDTIELQVPSSSELVIGFEKANRTSKQRIVNKLGVSG